jgi:hypothetical protein
VKWFQDGLKLPHLSAEKVGVTWRIDGTNTLRNQTIRKLVLGPAFISLSDPRPVLWPCLLRTKARRSLKTASVFD